MLRNSSALLLAVLLAAPMSAQTPDEAQPLAKSQTLYYRLPDKLNLAWADTRARSSGPTSESGRASESDRGPYLTLTAVQGTAGGTSYGAAAGEEEAPAGSSADDGDADETADDDPDRWKFTLAPYVWAASITGSGRVKGVRFSGTQSFSEVLDNLDIGVMGRVNAEKGNVGFIFDGMFMELSDDFSLGPVGADVRLQLMVFEWDATYRIYQLNLEEHIKDSTIDFRALVGARYVRLEGRINPDPAFLPTVEDSEDWIDPILGMQVHWKLPRNFWFRMKADFGGFGLGGSHFTWNLEPLLGYSFENGLFATAGYRVLDINYSGDGHGDQKFDFDGRFYGPMLGFGYKF